jgi:hypothetical protein
MTKGDDLSSPPKQHQKLSFNLKTVSNLTACLLEHHQRHNQTLFTSYAPHFSSKLTQFVFDQYFYLDEKRGVLYVRKRMDREVFCAKVANEAAKLQQSSEAVRLSSSKQHRPPGKKSAASGTVVRFRASASRNGTRRIQKRAATPFSSRGGVGLMFKPSMLLNSKFHDTVNCDCRSERCEVNFRFVAFKEKAATNTYKYVTLKVNINDLNDNTPKFAKNSLYLNVSESFGRDNSGRQADAAAGSITVNRSIAKKSFIYFFLGEVPNQRSHPGFSKKMWKFQI